MSCPHTRFIVRHNESADPCSLSQLVGKDFVVVVVVVVVIVAVVESNYFNQFQIFKELYFLYIFSDICILVSFEYNLADLAISRENFDLHLYR